MKSIEEELEDVNDLIEENINLQKKYPSYQFGLELGLRSLKEIRKEMIGALTRKKLKEMVDNGDFSDE